MELPNEIIVQIFENLDCKSLLLATEVCTNFRDLVVKTSSLQFIIELSVSGQKSGLQSTTVPSGDKLEQLKRHRDAWKNLQWSREIKIPMSNGGLWELCGGVLAQNTPEGELHFYQLPSDLRGIEEKRWTLGPDFGFNIRDFGMDPWQDLLVLMESPAPAATTNLAGSEYRVHLLSLSTGKPHPAAKNTILRLPQIERDRNVSYSMQVFGDFFGVHIYPMTAYENDVAIWNWKTGELQIDIFSEDIHSFSFLSNRWVVLAFTDLGQPYLWVLDFAEESAERHSLDDTSTGRVFEYPPFHVDKAIFLHDFHIRADPGCLTEANSRTPFLHDAKDFVLAVVMKFEVNNRAVKCLIHFIPSSHLISEMDRFESSNNGSPSDTAPSDTTSSDAASTDWDFTGDRMLLVSGHRGPSVIWVCYVYGTKFVLAEPAPRAEGGFSAGLYDFNQLALKRDARRDDGSEAAGRIEIKPSTIEEGDVFEVDLNTSLPYRHDLLTLEDAHEHCKVMCNEDCIVVVDQECREYRVLVF